MSLRLPRHSRGAALAIVVSASISNPAYSQDGFADAHLSLGMPSPAATAPAGDLTQMSLEDLMDVQVTSVTRQKQRLGDAAAAVHAISQENIRRSGMNTMADLLRMAPGLSVAQVDGSTWAVGSRGLGQVRTNNLLVLMDGRTVYTPLFAGTYWDTVDYVLEDIDRIEVVRGPGATLWGSNAVNGVISITSKSAQDTQGLLLQDYTGTDGHIGALRYGGNIDNRIYYRAYSKYRTMDDLPDPHNPNVPNGMDSHREGFRVDAYLSGQDQLTLQGDTFFNRAGHPRKHFSLAPAGTAEYSDITNTEGGNFLARYTHTFNEQSDFSVQVYYDKLHLTDHATYGQQTADIEFQHRFPLMGFQEIIWGAGYRLVSDTISPYGAATADGDYADPASRGNSLVSGFVQDDFTIVDKRLHFIVGTKLESTPYTGFEFQPSARIIFTPDDKHTLWGGVSRAVRSPGRAEHDGRVVGEVLNTPQVPTSINLVPSPDLRSEQLLALEAGYRVEPVKNLSIDIATFYNFHHGLAETVPSGQPGLALAPVPHVVVPTQTLNVANGNSYGAEVAINWKATDQLRLESSYSFVQYNLESTIGAADNGRTAAYESLAPEQQFQLRAYYDITKDLELNAATYFVDSLRAKGVPAYFRTDLNVVWRPEKHVEFTAGVRNLFDNAHAEFFDSDVRSTSNEAERTFFMQLSIKF